MPLKRLGRNCGFKPTEHPLPLPGLPSTPCSLPTPKLLLAHLEIDEREVRRKKTLVQSALPLGLPSGVRPGSATIQQSNGPSAVIRSA